MQFDFLVVIGRFEPFHNGRHSVVERALKLARQAIILIGSSASRAPFAIRGMPPSAR